MKQIMKKITVMAMALVLVVGAMSGVVGVSSVEAAAPKKPATIDAMLIRDGIKKK